MVALLLATPKSEWMACWALEGFEGLSACRINKLGVCASLHVLAGLLARPWCRSCRVMPRTCYLQLHFCLTPAAAAG
jgi:hypothetical protein